VIPGPFAEELEEAHILVEGPGILLGAQEFGELVQYQQGPLLPRAQPLPGETPVSGPCLYSQGPGDDLLQTIAGGEIDQREGNDPRRPRYQLAGIQLLYQVGEKVGLAGAIVADEKRTTPFIPFQQPLQRTQVGPDLGGDQKGVTQPMRRFRFQIGQAHHGGMGPDLEQLPDGSFSARHVANFNIFGFSPDRVGKTQIIFWLPSMWRAFRLSRTKPLRGELRFTHMVWGRATYSTKPARKLPRSLS